MKFFTLFRRNKETKTTPLVLETLETKSHRVMVPGSSPARAALKRKRKRVASKASRRKNRR